MFAPNGMPFDALLLKDGTITWDGPPLREHEIAALLEQLLAGDAHLRATCGSAFSLALVLQRLLLDSLSWMPELDQGDSLDERIAHELLDQLFAAEYVRRLYIRLYNVVVDDAPIECSFFFVSTEMTGCVARWNCRTC